MPLTLIAKEIGTLRGVGSRVTKRGEKKEEDLHVMNPKEMSE